MSQHDDSPEELGHDPATTPDGLWDAPDDGAEDDRDARDHEAAVQLQLKRRVYAAAKDVLHWRTAGPPPAAGSEEDRQFIWACGLVVHLAVIVLRDARCEADVEDAAQDVSLTLWLAWGLNPGLRTDARQLLNYIWTGLRNRRINLIRSYARSDGRYDSIDDEKRTSDEAGEMIRAAIELIDPNAIDAQVQLERLELLRFLHAEIALFPPKRRRIMELVFRDEMTHAEAAATLDTSQQNIARAVAIAMQVLRDRIADHFQETRS